jgi:hypothetical protein
MPSTTTPVTYTIDDQNGNSLGTYSTQFTSGIRPDSRYGAIVQDENGVTSSYYGATLQLTKRFSHGLQGALAYTWSHEYDDGQGYGQESQNIFMSSASGWVTNGNYKADRGDGLEDQPNRLVINWVWSPKLTSRTDKFSRYFINGWQLSSLTTINSSRPYGSPTVFVQTAPLSGGIGFSLNGQGLNTRVPFWAVDSIWLPAMYRSDARLTKMIPIGEHFRLSGSFEVFNLSNSWSPTGMTSQAFLANKNVLTLTPTAYNVGTADVAPPDGSEARSMQWAVRFTF